MQICSTTRKAVKMEYTSYEGKVDKDAQVTVQRLLYFIAYIQW